MRRMTSPKGSIGKRSSRARAKRPGARRRPGGFVAKPKTREAQIKWAETLGMDELGWVHGAGNCSGRCCCWGSACNPPRCP